MPEFLPGWRLSAACYTEVLAPVLELPHAAGLLGAGSDVLGYDTERSVDHDWGPRAVIFVEPEQVDDVVERVRAALPERFHGWPVSIGRDGVAFRPDFTVTTRATWTLDRLGFDPLDAPLRPVDWLTMPQQRILEVVAGPVFHDDVGDLTRLRAVLAWYPNDLWWWLLAGQWIRIAQEEAFVQRTAEVGDDLGSTVVTARLVRDAMRLALLIARQYAPYPKWLGTAFRRLPDPEGLGEALSAALRAATLRCREDALGAAQQILAIRFNAIAGTDLDTSLRAFHDRPAAILGAGRFAEVAVGKVADAELLALPPIGAIDQFVDSADVLTSAECCQRLRDLYRAP